MALLAALVLWRSAAAPPDVPAEFTGQTMGTTYSVLVDARMSAGERERARAEIERRLDLVNRTMSTYDPDSELSRLNGAHTTEPVPVSSELMQVLVMSREVSRRSGGAFDPTVGPLVEAWGFGPDGRPERWPDADDLAALRERVGHHKLLIDPRARTVAKADPRIRIDLSGIAKGYGVEQVAAGFVELGYRNVLVEIGGELEAVGTRRDGTPWRVGIERPEVDARTLFATAELADRAIATSGDYRNFYEDGGARYAHIIDPRTGLPIPFSGSAVSVIHADAAVADAWATALSVLGPEAGFELAEREGIAALFVVRDGDGFFARRTIGLRRATALTELSPR